MLSRPPRLLVILFLLLILSLLFGQLTSLSSCLPSCRLSLTPPPPVQEEAPVTVIPPSRIAPPTEPVATIPPEATPAWTEQALALLPSRAGDLERLHQPVRYEIDLQVWPAKSLLVGQMVAHYTNPGPRPLAQIPFRLFPNLPDRGGVMSVGTVTVDGQPVQPAQVADGTAILVPVHPPLETGREVSISLEFAADVPVAPSGGYYEFVNRDGIMALAGFYPLIPASTPAGWDLSIPPPYGDVVFAEIALFRVTATIPQPMILASTGVIVQQVVDAATQTRTIQLVSGPAREFNLVMSPDFQVATQKVGETTLRSYFKPENRTGGQRALKVAADSLALFNRLFGPYPYRYLEIAESPTIAGGIEYPGLIVINSNLYRGEGTRRLDWVVVHEVAHQWWYGLVGNDQVNEPWLDEALTNYSTWLFYEFTEPPEIAEDLFQQVFELPAKHAQEQGFDRPIGLPVEAYSPEEYAAIVYGKGPLFFHSLRQRVGDETFFTILRQYLELYEYRIAYGTDFLDLAEQISNQDLAPLYEEWVLGK